MSRTRDRNVAIAIISAVALGIAVMIAVTLWERGGDDDPVAAPTSDAVPLVAVHPSADEACDAFAETRVKPQRDQAAATADADDLADELMSRDGGPARSIDVDRCGRSYVVSVGVESLASIVPTAGPRGTPVVAYFQPLIVAN